MTRFASVLLALSLGLLAGCASLQGSKSSAIDSTGAIAGTWIGTVTPGHWGVADPFTLTVAPDGTLTAALDSYTAWGRVTVDSGRATFEMVPSLFEGTMRLYDNGDKRELVLKDEPHSLGAHVVPQK